MRNVSEDIRHIMGDIKGMKRHSNLRIARFLIVDRSLLYKVKRKKLNKNKANELVSSIVNTDLSRFVRKSVKVLTSQRDIFSKIGLQVCEGTIRHVVYQNLAYKAFVPR